MSAQDFATTMFRSTFSTDDEMKQVFKCKYCNKPEYYGDFRWLSGKMLCRSCYKAEWEHENKKLYIWDDLDGERPDESELMQD